MKNRNNEIWEKTITERKQKMKRKRNNEMRAKMRNRNEINNEKETM